MKFAYIADPHVDITTPVSRTDDYFEAIMAKLEYVFAHAEKQGCSAVLCGGDLFHKAVQPGTVMLRMIQLLTKYSVPLVTTVGQHDTNGHNIDDYPIKSLGLLEAAGLLRVLRAGESLTFTEDHDVVEVVGYAFGEPETEAFLRGKDAPTEGGPLRIALVHASIGPDECMGWEGVSNLKCHSADLALFGDIHQGFPPHETRAGTICLNPGSLGRRSVVEADHLPQFVMITVEDQVDIHLDYETVPGPPASEIFEREEQGDLGDLAEEFKAEWRKAQEAQDESPVDRVRRIGKAFGFDRPVVELVLHHIPQEED